jgi:NAD(P)-dependent dehydrogenase (short-subunit alcohol dehydrogenase family)
MSESLKKIALVTGANKGIGLEIATQLAHRGYTVYLAARNPELGHPVATKLHDEGLDVRFLQLDITDPISVEAAAKALTDIPALDVLVNNAGIITPGDGAASQSTAEAIQKTLQTNFAATVAVTQALLPLLRKSTAGRIVNVSSGLGSVTQAADPNWIYAPNKYLAYGASKAALNMFTAHLAYELRDTPIKVNSADPGYTATDLNGHHGTQTIPEGAAEAIRLATLPDDGPTGTFSDSAGIVPW